MTAHGGFLQAILQGLTGLRFDFDLDDRNKLSRMLTLDPISLPCLGNGVQFDSIKYMNQSISLAINETSFIIKHNGPIAGGDSDSIRISLAKRNPKSGVYTLDKGEELVFPLFVPTAGSQLSVSECASAKFINITESAYGDATVLVNDGDNTTHWQLKYNDTTAKILVDLKQSRNLTSGAINWGDGRQRVGLCWLLVRILEQSKINDLNDVIDFLSKVNFGNDLYKKYQFIDAGTIDDQDDVFTTIVSEEVDISAPFDPKDYVEIKTGFPHGHNTTSFNIEQGLGARFLLIEVTD